MIRNTDRLMRRVENLLTDKLEQIRIVEAEKRKIYETKVSEVEQALNEFYVNATKELFLEDVTTLQSHTKKAFKCERVAQSIADDLAVKISLDKDFEEISESDVMVLELFAQAYSYFHFLGYTRFIQRSVNKIDPEKFATDAVTFGKGNTCVTTDLLVEYEGNIPDILGDRKSEIKEALKILKSTIEKVYEMIE